MLLQEDERIELERNPVVRLARRVLPFATATTAATSTAGRADGRLLATPLVLVLLVVEWSDLVFAIDSIPAIFAITRDPFLVYSSNVFAILGLRALFFVLAGMMDRFVYLKPGVALILVFVGREDGAERLAARPDPGEPRSHRPHAGRRGRAVVWPAPGLAQAKAACGGPRLPDVDPAGHRADVDGGHGRERPQVDHLHGPGCGADPLDRHERVAVVRRDRHAVHDLPLRSAAA